MSEDYKVGYKQPPVHTQFKKGQSGYPSDRPRKKKRRVPDVQPALIDALNAPIAVNDNGKRRKLSSVEVLFKQLVNKAAAGNAAQQRILLPILMKLIDINRANELQDPGAARQAAVDLQRELDAIFSAAATDLEIDPGASILPGDEPEIQKSDNLSADKEPTEKESTEPTEEGN